MKDYKRRVVVEIVECDEIANIGSESIVDTIANLRKVLKRIPKEFRDRATLGIYAYDWDGVDVTYERPMADEEYEAHLAEVEARRLETAGEIDPEWIRNVRMYGPVESRDGAIEYIRTNPASNQYHPSVMKKPTYGTWPPA